MNSISFCAGVRAVFTVRDSRKTPDSSPTLSGAMAKSLTMNRDLYEFLSSKLGLQSVFLTHGHRTFALVR